MEEFEQYIIFVKEIIKENKELREKIQELKGQNSLNVKEDLGLKIENIKTQLEEAAKVRDVKISQLNDTFKIEWQEHNKEFWIGTNILWFKKRGGNTTSKGNRNNARWWNIKKIG